MSLSRRAPAVLAATFFAAVSTIASPTTVTFTNGVNGYTGTRDMAVYEPGKMSDWGRFYFGDSYMLINEQPG